MICARAAPHGNRAGLAVATVGGSTLEILVLPKVWRAGRPASWAVPAAAPGESSPLLLAVHEGDWIQFPPEYTAHVAQLTQHSARDPAKGRGEDRPSPLLVRDVAPSRLEADPAPYQRRADHEGLLALALLAHRADPAGESIGVASSVDHGGVQGIRGGEDEAASPVAALLLAWSLARAVEARLRDVRRGYTPNEEWRSTVRGRLLVPGLVRHDATGLPELLCADEDFTDAIPLYRVIVAGLQEGLQIARQGTFAATPLAAAVARDLARLRRHLSHVHPFPRREAVVAARRLRLPRLMQPWAAVVRICLRVLMHEVPSAKTGDPFQAVVQSWVVNTPRLWELLVVDALRGAAGAGAAVWDGNTSSKDFDCASPWAGLGGQKRPDIVLRRGSGAVLVADAKYKDPAFPLAMEDQYQIFAYSHLVRVGGEAPVAVAVVRPGGAVGRTHGRGSPPALPLYDLQIPFPGPGAPLSELAWREAQQAMQAGWKGCLQGHP